MFSNFTNRLEVDMESLLTREQQSESTSSSYLDLFQSSSPEETDHGCCATASAYCPSLSLTLQQRIGGCLGCMTLGYMLSFGSFFRFRDLISGTSTTFVLYFTLGNILSLAGSCFLSGPTSQLDKMWSASRRGATCMYLGSLVLTLALSIVCSHQEWKIKLFGGNKSDAWCIFTLILCMSVQYVAVAWYCLSYVPFARQLAKRLWRRLCSTVLDFDGWFSGVWQGGDHICIMGFTTD